MARKIARSDRVDLPELLDFLRGRHDGVLVTSRRDGSPQLSPVTYGVDGEGRILVSTYPERAKVHNLRRNPAAALMAVSSPFADPWVQVDGTAEVLDLPEAIEDFVEYYRVIAGEHPDWEEYRAAMLDQGKCLVRITITRWGPIATGGFPARLA